MAVLLNVFDGTRFYVRSYPRDARLRPPRPSKQLWTMATASAGQKWWPSSTTIIGSLVACLRGSWGTLSAKGSVTLAYFDFATR